MGHGEGKGRGGCLLAIADVCIWLTIICSIAALFAPFWYSSTATISGVQASSGLFMACVDPYHKHDIETSCEFGEIDLDLPKWFTAVQGLWAGGTALMFLLGITSFFLCCDSCRKASCTSLVFVGTLIAALAFVAAVVVFGIKQDDFGVKFDRNSVVYFDWGFYLAIAAAGLSLIAALLFGFVICCLRKE